MSKNQERLSSRAEMSPEQREIAIRRLGCGAMDCHHIIWMKRNHKDFIRAMEVFQPQMYKPAHKALHEDCPSVPRFNDSLLKIVRADFKPNDNTIDSLDRLLFLINGVDETVMKGFIKELTLHALESQIPYLKGNIKPAIGYHK
jgi:hypothetical protein